MSRRHAVSIPAETKALHRRLSAREVAFLEAVEEGRSELRSLLARSRLPAWHATYKYPMQSWPKFVAGEKLRQIRGAAVGVAKLLKRVPELVFENDVERIAAFYRIDDPMIVFALLQPPTGLDGALLRGDFIDSAEGFKCVEYNASACLGGWQTHFYADELLATPPVSELRGRGESEARYVDPLNVLFGHLARQAKKSGVAEADDQLNVVILVAEFVEGAEESPVGLPEYLQENFVAAARQSEESRSCSLQVLVRDQLQFRKGRLFTAGGQRVHALVEYQMPGPDQELFRAHKAGGLDHYNPPLLTLIGDKRNLALLHEHADSPRLSAEERRCIRDHVPATAVVTPGEVTWNGERRPLESLASAERQRLVLKHGFGTRGEDLLLGWKTSARRWDEAVRQALDSGLWIFQERVDSVPYWCMGQDGEPGPQTMVWGLFVFGDRYGGTFLRMAPVEGSGIVNSAQGASEGILLEIEADGE